MKTIEYLGKKIEYYDYYLTTSSCIFTLFNVDDVDVAGFFGSDIITSLTLANDETGAKDEIQLNMKYKSNHKEHGSIKRTKYEVVTPSYYSEELIIDSNTGEQVIGGDGVPMVRTIFHPADIKTTIEEEIGVIITVVLEPPNIYDTVNDISTSVQKQSISFSVARISAQSFSDTQALEVKEIFYTYDELVKKGFIAKEIGYKFIHNDELYKTAQADLLFQSQYVPGQGTESLYTHIDESHAGTLEDPIPAFANMEYFQGKYYIENDIVYLCNSELAKDGIVLQFMPSQLVGIYFEKVESDE